MILETLFAQFLKEKQFLICISPKTIRSYRQASMPIKESLASYCFFGGLAVLYDRNVVLVLSD